MKQTITIGTRGSQLALWQAEYVRKRLHHHFPDRSIEIKVIKTTGDKIRDRSLVGPGQRSLYKGDRNRAFGRHNRSRCP